MGDGRSGLHDQFQGQDDQAKTNPYPPQLADPGLLAGKEEDHAQKDQQRRQPRQVKGQHPGHERGADIGAKHDRQGWGHGHQALADEGCDQHGSRVAALHHGGNQNPGDERQGAFVHVLADDAAQVGTEYPQDASTHDMCTPDQ
ncbi:hypothetical protein D3C81_1084330 [compost metagenome]